MLLIVLICVAVSAAFVLLFLLEIAPGRNPLGGPASGRAAGARAGTRPPILQRRRRQARTERLKGVVQAFGEAVQERQRATVAPCACG